AEPHVAGPMRTQVLTGLESWFTLPTQPGVPPPPPYKMALVTWVTIFPLITLVVVATAPLLGPLPLVARLGGPPRGARPLRAPVGPRGVCPPPAAKTQPARSRAGSPCLVGTPST